MFYIILKNSFVLKEVAGIEVPDFSFETFDEFQDSRKRIRKFVDRIVDLQKGIEFIAEKKAGIDSDKWRKIFKRIDKSRNKNNFQKPTIEITGGFVAKLYLIFGDKHLVSLLVLLIESGILSISDSRVNEILLEIENKIFAPHESPGIDLLRTHTEILANGGERRYAGVISDSYFDRKDVLLKENGGRQLRTRERILVDGNITETLTGKRKLSKMKDKQEYALSHFLEKLGEDVDVEQIEDVMKILLEDEMDIHDMEALEDILEILHFFVNRSKIKLRASMKLKSSKFELEYYPGIRADKSSTGEMRPFVEQESGINMQEAEELRRLINLYGDDIVLSDAGSEGAFGFDGAEDSYLRFGNGGTKDSRVHQAKDRIKRQAMRLMYNGYFDTFRV